MLKITHLHKTFFPNTPNEKKALRGVNLTLEEGDFVTVIGSNGSGKSTLIQHLQAFFILIKATFSLTESTSHACPSMFAPSTSDEFSRIR